MRTLDDCKTATVRTRIEESIKAVEGNRYLIADVARGWRSMVAFHAGMTVWRRIGIDWFAPLNNINGVKGENGEVTYIDRGPGRTPIPVFPLKHHREQVPGSPYDMLPSGGREDVVVTETGDVIIGLFWRGNYVDMADETGDLAARVLANSNK